MNKRGFSKIANIWFLFSLFIITVLIIQTITDKYGESIRDVWGWYVSAIAPTLTVIIAFYFDDEYSETPKVGYKQVRIAKYLSIIYLTSLLLVFFVEPLSSLLITEIMSKFQIFIGVLQGFITLSVIKIFK